MGEAPWFVAVGQGPEVAAVGYACASPGLAQVAGLADRLPWYQHRQPIDFPSLPGQVLRGCLDPNNQYNIY
jgi:hypothetical protein